MFQPQTEKIKQLQDYFPNRIKELEKLFFGNANVYIDYANIRPWSNKLGWHINLKRLKQFLNSFDNIKKIKIYSGTLQGNRKSGNEIELFTSWGYDVKTKPVKIMRHSINTTSVESTSPALLANFIRKCLLKKFDLETIEYLNNKFREMNKAGIYFIEDLKCNFDVEIGRDMLLDYKQDKVDTFVLWSGDSDFADPLAQLLDDGKKAVICATARRVASEINELRNKGLAIFDIKKIRNFICWGREIDQEIADFLKAKETSTSEAPKL